MSCLKVRFNTDFTRYIANIPKLWHSTELQSIHLLVDTVFYCTSCMNCPSNKLINKSGHIVTKFVDYKTTLDSDHNTTPYIFSIKIIKIKRKNYDT